jgi:adenosylcobinamide kinase / adenosylcobinamide-phosphate guanylyltransferase
MAGSLGGRVLYAATALPNDDPELRERVRLHRERRPAAWGTVEAGDLASLPEEAGNWDAVLLDSLTLWVSAQLDAAGEEGTLASLGRFLEEAAALPTPFVLVSDEVGLGVVPESAEGRMFRDVLGAANGRAAAAAGEVYLCVAGIGVRIK